MAARRMTRSSRKEREARPNNVAVFICFVFLILSVVMTILLGEAGVHEGWVMGEFFVLNLVGIYILVAYKIANQWEKAIVLRLGRFVGLKGPGPFWIIPSWTRFPPG